MSEQFSHQRGSVSVIGALPAVNRPQIAAYPSDAHGHVRERWTLQRADDVPESRPVSTTAETIYKQSVAGRIREARARQGISQGTLAGVIGRRRTHVNEWENAHHVPSWENLERLGNALDVTPHWLLTGHDEPGGPT